MGTAATIGKEAAEADNSSDQGAESVNRGATDGANACHSFWEVGAGAGVKGAEGCDGFAQQAGVAQLFMSQPEQQQLRWAARSLAPRRAVEAKTPCNARTIPSRSTTATLIGRKFIPTIGRSGPAILTESAKTHPARKLIFRQPLGYRFSTSDIPHLGQTGCSKSILQRAAR